MRQLWCTKEYENNDPGGSIRSYYVTESTENKNEHADGKKETHL